MDTKDEHVSPRGDSTVWADTGLADRRTFALDERAWAAFDTAMHRPAHDVPGLRRLVTEPTVLDHLA